MTITIGNSQGIPMGKYTPSTGGGGGGGGADLSNYYNKAETDGLLENKENKITPVTPISLTENIRSSFKGFTYSDETHVYPTTPCQFMLFNSNTAGNLPRLLLVDINSQNSEDIWGNYIDIPYSLGDIIKLPDNYTINFGITFGYYQGAMFVPVVMFNRDHFYGDDEIFIASNSANLENPNENPYTYDDNLYGHQYYYAYRLVRIGGGSHSYTDQPATLVQVNRPSSNINKIRAYLYDHGTQLHASLEYNCSAETTYNGKAFDKINVARIHGRSYNSNSTLDITQVGKYSSGGINLWDTELSDLSILGDSSFVIGEAIKRNYLELKYDNQTITTNSEGELVANLDDHALKSEIPDVSNLATKTELEAKQDVLNAIEPIRLIERDTISLTGYSYTSDNTAVYPETTTRFITPSGSSNLSISIKQFGYTETEYTSSTLRSYVAIPYILGQIVKVPLLPGDEPYVYFGKLSSDGKFYPIISPTARGWGSFIMATDDAYTVTNGDGSTADNTFTQITMTNTKQIGIIDTSDYLTPTVDPSICEPGTALLQIYDLATNMHSFEIWHQVDSTGYWRVRRKFNENLITASDLERLREINCCMVTSYSSGVSYSYPVASFGLYDATGELGTVTPSLTENLFDITSNIQQQFVELNYDNQTLQVNSEGKLVVNLDELGNEVNAISGRVTTLETNMGGLKLQNITQADYDALIAAGTVDENTLYLIVEATTE